MKNNTNIKFQEVGIKFHRVQFGCGRWLKPWNFLIAICFIGGMILNMKTAEAHHPPWTQSADITVREACLVGAKKINKTSDLDTKVSDLGGYRFCTKSTGYNTVNAFWLACLSSAQYAQPIEILEMLWGINQQLPKEDYSLLFPYETEEGRDSIFANQLTTVVREMVNSNGMRANEKTTTKIEELSKSVHKDSVVDFISTPISVDVQQRFNNFRRVYKFLKRVNHKKQHLKYIQGRRELFSDPTSRGSEISESTNNYNEVDSPEDIERYYDEQVIDYKVANTYSSDDIPKDMHFGVSIKFNEENLDAVNAGGTQAVWIEGKRAIYIIFRGTEPDFLGGHTEDIYTDDMAFQLGYYLNLGGGNEIPMYNHLGFLVAHKEVFNKFIKEKMSNMVRRLGVKTASQKPIYLTGHSLGGALATYTAMELLKWSYDIKNGSDYYLNNVVLAKDHSQWLKDRIAKQNVEAPCGFLNHGIGEGLRETPRFNIKGLYTFGSPRTGGLVHKKVFECLAARSNTTVVRVVNERDLVSRSPFYVEGKKYAVPYHHVGSIVQLGHFAAVKKGGRPAHSDKIDNFLPFNVYMDFMKSAEGYDTNSYDPTDPKNFLYYSKETSVIKLVDIFKGDSSKYPRLAFERPGTIITEIPELETGDLEGRHMFWEIFYNFKEVLGMGKSIVSGVKGHAMKNGYVGKLTSIFKESREYYKDRWAGELEHEEHCEMSYPLHFFSAYYFPSFYRPYLTSERNLSETDARNIENYFSSSIAPSIGSY